LDELSLNDIQESMAFCSNKIDDCSLKFDSLVINVNENNKKIQGVEYKFAKILNKIDFL